MFKIYFIALDTLELKRLRAGSHWFVYCSEECLVSISGVDFLLGQMVFRFLHAVNEYDLSPRDRCQWQDNSHVSPQFSSCESL